MKRGGMFWIVCLCGLVGWASVAGASLQFSTGGANTYSWTVEVTSGVATISFENNEVDASDPSPDAVLNDFLDMPSMTLSGITPTTIPPGVDVITASLVPDGSPLTITSDVAVGPVPAATEVMSADVAVGGLLTVGTNFIAYSNEADDLDLIGYEAGYSAVIDGFAAAEAAGIDLDLSFGGDASASLYQLLADLNDGSVSGTLSGQIVPEPMTLSLCALGAAVLLRRRKR